MDTGGLVMTGGGAVVRVVVMLSVLLCCCKAWRGHNLASTDQRLLTRATQLVMDPSSATHVGRRGWRRYNTGDYFFITIRYNRKIYLRERIVWCSEDCAAIGWHKNIKHQ